MGRMKAWLMEIEAEIEEIIVDAYENDSWETFNDFRSECYDRAADYDVDIYHVDFIEDVCRELWYG